MAYAVLAGRRRVKKDFAVGHDPQAIESYGNFLFVCLLEGEQRWVGIHRFCEYHGEEGERKLGRGSSRVFGGFLGPEAI